MSDKTTMIVTSTPDPNQPDALAHYVQEVIPMLLAIGGNPIKRSMITDVFLGAQSFSTLLVMEFPSKQDLINLFQSNAYQQLIPARDKAFKNIEIFFASDLS